MIEFINTMNNTETNMESKLIDISKPAQEYLAALLDKQEGVYGVFVSVHEPGTADARTILSYCREELSEHAAKKICYDNLLVYVDKDSSNYINGTIVDLEQDGVNSQITVRSPNSKTPILPDNPTIEDRVRHVLAMAVNPMLASHGGGAILVKVTEDNVAVLEFKGGCQGCAAVPVTMKYGVEKQIKSQVPEILRVEDITDHSVTENAYYKP